METRIEYIYITKQPDFINFLIPPIEFNNNIFEFIKACPKDIVQLRSPVDYYEAEIVSQNRNCLRFSIIYENDFVEFIDKVLQKNKIYVFLLDFENVNDINILNKIKSISCHYIVSLTSGENENKNLNGIHTPLELIKCFQNDLDKLKKVLNITFDFNIRLNSEGFNNHNEFYYFKPAIINYLIINQIIGDYWTNNIEFKADIEILKQNSLEAHKDWYSKNRQLVLLKKLKQNDCFINVALHERLFVKDNSIHPSFSTIIFAAPSHNPKLNSILGQNSMKSRRNENSLKMDIKLLQAEQTINYISIVEPNKVKSDKFEIPITQKIIAERQQFIDNVGYLHATFYNSPYFRCPIKGKSIYNELAFFDPDTFKKRKHDKFLRKVKSAILSLGKKIASELLIDEMKEYLKHRNGQIFVISDLPIEWLVIDEIPLAFTHDICRMPENPLHGLLANYTLNSLGKYNITKSILSKTLIIFGTKQPDFVVWHSYVENLKPEFHFNSVYCSSILEVTNAIKKYQPELLIFDCHGDYDKNTFSTYLWIENEKLTGDLILQNKITAPLIFLSACGTAPTYGSINTIANAFFQAGSLSVTTTYLPVNINSASKLYTRLLYKLDYAAKHGIHKNWLEFISHLTRTSGFIESYHKVFADNINQIDKNEYEKSLLQDLSYSLDFHSRRDVYKNIDIKLKSLSTSTKDYFTDIIPEYLFYSHLGRSDLIYFDEWYKRIEMNIIKNATNI